MAYSDKAGHDLKLEAVLKRLEDAGLSIGLDKYILANRKIEYLGYEVSEGGQSTTSEQESRGHNEVFHPNKMNCCITSEQ